MITVYSLLPLWNFHKEKLLHFDSSSTPWLSISLGQRTSQKPAGSKFLEPVFPMNIGSGPSPPTYPLANSFRLEEVRVTCAGANAQAEAISDARITDFMVV